MGNWLSHLLEQVAFYNDGEVDFKSLLCSVVITGKGLILISFRESEFLSMELVF